MGEKRFPKTWKSVDDAVTEGSIPLVGSSTHARQARRCKSNKGFSYSRRNSGKLAHTVNSDDIITS